MRRLAVTLAAAVLVGVPAPAQAAPYGELDASGVCVVSHVGKRWAVARAVRVWNRTAAPNFHVSPRCAAGADRVVIRLGREPAGVTGAARIYKAGAVREVEISLDAGEVRAFPRGSRRCLRRWTVTHELGHALGLHHAGRRSTMSYQAWSTLCGRITSADRGAVRRLYR